MKATDIAAKVLRVVIPMGRMTPVQREAVKTSDQNCEEQGPPSCCSGVLGETMRCHLYLRKGKVFIPTFGRVPRGPYRDIEPVAVVEVSDAAGLRRAFRDTIARGNPPVGPYPRPNPPPVVVKYAGVKSWGTFARGALPWSIEEENGIFQIIGRRKTPDGWVEDSEQTINFRQGTTLDQVIDRMIAILQEAARN